MIGHAFDMPWRVANELRRYAALPYIRLMFALHGIRWQRGWRIFGMPLIQRHRGSTIELGTGLELRSWRSSNPLMPNHPCVFSTRTAQAVIRVGPRCSFTGAMVVALESIQIGADVLVGTNAAIVDSDFHPLYVSQRLPGNVGRVKPVVIRDQVFIGMNSLILKGVEIGQGSVIGAGSVVIGNIPPGVIAAGNPAQVVREL